MAEPGRKLPVRSWLELHADSIVYRHTSKKGRFRWYNASNTAIGSAEEVEKKRPDLIPKIKNWGTAAERGVVPIAARVEVKDLPKRLGLIKDAEIVRAMMATDKRPGAQKCYIHRLERLEEKAAEEAAEAIA